MSAKSFKKHAQKQIDYANADTVNHEGHPAYARKGRERLREILFLGNVGNTFYVSESANVEKKVADLSDLILKEVDPKETAELIAAARQEGLFRTIPITALALLRKRDPKSFREIFPKVVLTGNDMKDFLDINRIVSEGFGASVKKAVNAWLVEKVNEFYALKYRKQISDAIAIARPKVSGAPNAKILRYAYGVKKPLTKEELKEIKKEHEQIAYAEKFKKRIAKGKMKKALKAVKKGRLPADLVIGMAGNVGGKKFWKTVAENMGTMQLLKYLNKLDAEGVDVTKFRERFSYENIKKAKIFPYRLFVAWLNGTPAVKEIMKEALENISENKDLLSDLWKEKSWAICPDVSGSMIGGYWNRVNGMSPSMIAGFFSSFLAKQLEVDEVLAWDTDLHPVKTSGKSAMDIYDRVARGNGWGTDMSIPIEHLTKTNQKKDVVVIITDSEHWYRGNVKNAWREYKKNVAPDAKLVVIEVVGYGTSVMDEKFVEKYDVYTVFGWTDSVFKWIEQKVLS